MAKLLSICEHCGVIFPNPAFELREGAELTVRNITFVVPCPNCGNNVSISPQGVFKSIKGVVQFLGTPDRSIEELQKLTRLIENAKDEGQNATEFSETLNKELPELSPISDFLLRHATTTNFLIGFFGLLLTAISTIITIKTYQESHQQKPNVDPKIVINQTYNIYNSPNNENQKKAKSPKPMPRTVGKKKGGVNALCECGSGRKRKKCHP